MKMNREELKALGLSDEQVESVMKAHGKTLNDTKVKADKVDGLESQLEDLQGQLTDRDDQLEKLKKVDADALQQTIDDLQSANKTQKDDYEATLKEERLNSAIKLSVADKAHDADLVLGQIDKEKLVIGADGKVVGLDEQINSLKEAKGFLFKADDSSSNGPQIVPPGNPNGGGGGVVSREQIMKEPDNIKRQQLIQENSHLFQ